MSLLIVSRRGRWACPRSSEMSIQQRAETQSSNSPIRHNANVNGIRLHYAESGSGENLVILLHGFPEFWYSWRNQLTVLGKSHHVIAPDMRGYNLSDKPPRAEDYRIEVLVEDVIGLIKHFGADKAAIVGHDWGASVAWVVAQKYPQHVSKTGSIAGASRRSLASKYHPAAVVAKLVYVFLPASTDS